MSNNDLLSYLLTYIPIIGVVDRSVAVCGRSVHEPSSRTRPHSQARLIETRFVKLGFHDADTDTDTDILARIIADTRDSLKLFLWRLHSRDDRHEEVRVGVGVGVVEFQLNWTMHRARTVPYVRSKL